MELLGLFLLVLIFGPPAAIAFGFGWFFGSRSTRRKMEAANHYNWSNGAINGPPPHNDRYVDPPHLQQRQRWDDEYNGHSPGPSPSHGHSSSRPPYSPGPVQEPNTRPGGYRSWYRR